MFGFSIQKLLFTAIVIAAIRYAFKWLGRLQEQKRHIDREQARKTRDSAAGTSRAAQVEDMVACPQCGTYVAVGDTHNCGKRDCPYPD